MKVKAVDIISDIGVFFLASWIFMLIWGALGHQLDFFTITYWQSCLILLGIRSVRLSMPIQKKGGNKK